mgnify:CR=1 FL=1
MKIGKIFSTLLSALFFNQVSYGSNILFVHNSESNPKSSVTIFIGTNNDTPFNALQFDLLFPPELKWKTDGVRVTARANGHSVSASLIESGKLRVVAWSATNENFTGTSGNIVEIDFISGINPGTFPVTIENAILSGTDGNILTSVINGTFMLKTTRASLSAMIIDWGRVPLLQETRQTLTIANSGNLPLVVGAFDFTDSRFSISKTLPFTLAAGESDNIDIKFCSTIKGVINSRLTITSNDPEEQKFCDLKVVAFAVNELHIGTASGRSGYEITIPVSVNNMEPFTAFQLKIKLPAVTKFIKGSEVLNTSRKVDHVIAADTSKDILTLVAYSLSNSPFNLNDGVVLSFTLMVEGQGGRYPLSNLESVISDMEGFNSMSARFDGWIEIAAPQLAVSSNEINFGDVSNLESVVRELILYNNGSDDLIINQIAIGDKAFTHSKILPFTIHPGKNKVIFLVFSANDGLIHQTILRIRSNDSPHDPKDVLLKARSFFPNELRVSDLTVRAGTTDTMFVELFNQLQVSGFQFDIGFPVGINPITGGVFLTARKDDHVAVASEISQGKIRVLSYSGSLKSFIGNSGDAIGIPVQISESLSGTYPIQISNIVISDNNGKSIGTGSKSGSIKVQLPTYIMRNYSNSEFNIYPNPFDKELHINLYGKRLTSVSMYNLSGQKITIENKGVNNMTINTENLKPSVYILKIEFDKEERNVKVMKVN